MYGYKQKRQLRLHLTMELKELGADSQQVDLGDLKAPMLMELWRGAHPLTIELLSSTVNS